MTLDLVESVLRVRDSKTEEGIRSIALPSRLAEALWQHRRRSAFQGDGELVFCHPERGTSYDADAFKAALAAAMTSAGVAGPIRAFHDLRHTAITHDAAAGSSEIAVMAKAGHRNMARTRTYLHLAGRVFRAEAERLEHRLLAGGVVPQLGEIGSSGADRSTRSSTHLGECQTSEHGENGSSKPFLTLPA